MPDVTSHLRDAGFSDDEITAWSTEKRGQLAAGGFTEPEIDDYFGMPKTPDTIPMPLLDRIGKGVKFARDIVETPMNVVGGEIASAQIENVQGAVKNLLPKSLGGGREPAAERADKDTEFGGMGPTAAGLMYALGSFPPFAVAQGIIQAVIGHPLVATDEALRGGAVKLFGEEKVAEAERAAGEHAGGGSVGGMTLEEARGIANRAMMALGPNPLTRIGFGAMGEAETVAIGALPKGEDFSTAGKVLGNGDTTPAMEQKLADLYEEKGIHPAEVAHDAQSDPTITQSILSSDPKDMPGAYGPPRPPPEVGAPVQPRPDMYAPPDPLELARSGELSADRAKEIGEQVKANQNEIENKIFGNEELADKWRKLHRQSDRAWDSANDAKAKDYDRQISELEESANLTEQDQSYLNGEGWPEHSNYESWRDLASDLRDVEGDRADAVATVGYALRRLPEAGKPLADFERQNLAVIQHALNEETKRGGDPGKFLQDAFRKSGERYGGGPDAEEIIASDMERLQKLLENPPEPQKALAGPAQPPSGPPPPRQLPPPSSGPPPERPPPYSDAEKQILSKISIGEESPTSKMTWNDIYTNFIDKLFPISKAVKDVGAELSAEDNPYQRARLLSGYVGKADHFLNNGTFDFSTYAKNGPSLKEILRPVGDLNGFRAYATAQRALELEGRGIKSGFAEAGPSAPPLVSTGLDAARTVVADGAGKYEQPFRALVDYQNRVSQYLRDSGVLSDAGYKAMVEANKMYVPFSRVMGIDADSPHVGGSTLQAHNPIRAIKGSARDIIDPIESVIRNTYHFVEMAEKNVVGTKLVDMLANASKELPEAPGAVKAEVAHDAKAAPAMKEALAETGIKNADDLAASLAHASAPVRQDEIAILRNGKRETYTVDTDLARAMKGLDAQSMGVLEKILSYPASLLRAGAVTTPDFAIRHTIRDFLYATTTFKDGVFHPFDMAKGFSGLIMKDEDYWNWLKGGGGNISLVGIDRRYMQADLQKLTGETGLIGRAWNVISDPGASMWDKAAAGSKLPFQAIGKFVLDPLRLVTQFAENASHLAAFKKTMRVQEAADTGNLRSQIINAAWRSRDTAVDAARMGANMRAYNMITAFANIKLQDTDRVVRAIKDNPIKSLTTMGGAITVPSVLLWAANHNDPRYDEIPRWEKDLFFIVMTGSGRDGDPGNHIFRIPKPWAMGQIFGSLPERLLDEYASQKPDAFKDYFKDLWATSGPDFIPSAAAPIIDQFANRSTFTNRTLIPSEQEKFLPEYQYTPYTTELTKSLGKVIGAFPGMSDLKMDNSGFGGTARALTSPILMENYIRGWSGTLGVYALNAADAALRKAGALPDPPQPARTLADIPIIKAFVVRYPSASAESIQGFYDEYARNKSYFDTFMAKAKDGDIAATQHIQEMGGPMMFVQLDGIKSVLTEHSQLIRDLYKNPDVPPDEKRQLVDQLYFSMIQVAQHGNGVIKSLKDAATVRGALLPTTGLPEPATTP